MSGGHVVSYLWAFPSRPSPIGVGPGPVQAGPFISMARSNTTRSIALLRDRGYQAERTEHYNPFCKRYFDLFGFIDILAVKEGCTLAIQTTSRGGMSQRRRKILEHENLAAVLAAGWGVELHGWDKRNRRWRVKVERLQDGGFHEVE